MTADLVRVRVQLPFGSVEQFARFGPSWTDLFIREGTSDEDVLREVWLEDTYRVRGLDLTPKVTVFPAVDGLRTKTEGRTVIDVGACTGIFSALCLAFGASHVIAVEPEPDNCALLRRNLAPYGDRFAIIEGAVSADDLSVHLDGNCGTGHTSPIGLTSSDEPIPLCVPGHTLADIIDAARTPVALLKCDIEGGEFDAFAACSSHHLVDVERIAMEWHGPSQAPWVGRARIGELVQHLQVTHSCTLFGRPDDGGYLFAHRNDL